MKQKLIDYWQSFGIIKDKKAIEAFKKINREHFINEGLKGEAYGDYPLPIGSGQTISQPTTVMLMTQALELKEGQKVLEVGSGSGYQAAIISEIIGKKGRVVTTEIIKGLADFAKANIKKAGIKNVEVVNYDGSQGYKKEAPYDRIIITAACPEVPMPLISQLKDDGMLIAPVGSLALGQKMLKIKKKDNKLQEESLGDFVFVPLRGKYGHSS